MQKAGGLFQLLAEVDFGTSYGLKSLYIKSRTANVASASFIRLANTDEISWRNFANDGDLSLEVNSSDELVYNNGVISAPIQTQITVSDTSTIDLTLTGSDLSADIVAGSITNSMVNAAAAIAYSKLNLTGSVVNADINAAAAIAYSKLSLSGAIVNADVSASAAIAYSKLALTGSIVDADLSASAAIAFSKLATLSSGNILVGSAGNVATSVAMSGDTTISAAGAVTIGANKVSNAKLAQMATLTIKGNNTGGASDPLDLTGAQATAILSNFVGDSGAGGTKGLVLAPAAGDAAAGKFLKADGTWTAPSGSGDVVGPASATDNGFVRFDGTTGKLIKDSAATIVNADVNAAAAIAYSKLNLATSIVNADIAGAAAIALSKLAATTASRALVSDGSGFISAATTTATEIGYVNGVTSAIQTQLDAKVAKSTYSAKGSILVATAASTPADLPVGADGYVIKADSGQASGLAWAALTTLGAAPQYNFTAQTGTYSATINDWIKASGASFTITLPTAVGQSGKTITIQHAGTSYSQVYTLNTTSAQTIGGIASGSYKIVTNGELLQLVSDNANWQIGPHRVSLQPTTATLSTAGVGTTSNDVLFLGREGKFLIGYGSFTVGTKTATPAAINLPSGLTIDTATFSTGLMNNYGTWFSNINITGTVIPINTRGPYNMVLDPTTSTTKVFFSSIADLDAVRSGSLFFIEDATANGNITANTSFTFKVPITEFQP